MTPCYILKRTFTKVNLLNYPNNLGGGCYLANRITTKLHLHFPLPHYNDTVLYSKTNFYKSQPPQLPQQLGCAISQTGLPQNSISTSPSPITMTPCYILKRSLTKKSTSSIPPTLGGLSQETGPPQNFTPSYNDVVLYSKTNFNKSQPPRFPQHWGGGGGGAITQTGLPQNSHLHFPPYNNVVLYFKTIFYKRQPPQFPQQLGGGYLTNRTTTKLHLPSLQWCRATF